MPFIVYAAILITAVFSVVLEWDTLVEHPPAVRHAVQAVVPASPPPPQTTTDAVVPVTPPPAQPAQPAAAEAPPAHCNVDACAGAYRSFRASDCTWQPNEGSRRLCVK